MTSVYQPVSQSQPSQVRSEVNETFTYPALFDTKAEAASRPLQRVTSSVSITLSNLVPQEVGPTKATSKLVVPADKQATVSDEFVRLTPPPSGAPRSPLSISAAPARTASPFRRQESPAQAPPSPLFQPVACGAEPPIVPSTAPSISQERVLMRSPMPSAALPRAALHQSMMPTSNQSAKAAFKANLISEPFPDQLRREQLIQKWDPKALIETLYQRSLPLSNADAEVTDKGPSRLLAGRLLVRCVPLGAAAGPAPVAAAGAHDVRLLSDASLRLVSVKPSPGGGGGGGGGGGAEVRLDLSRCALSLPGGDGGCGPIVRFVLTLEESWRLVFEPERAAGEPEDTRAEHETLEWVRQLQALRSRARPLLNYPLALVDQTASGLKVILVDLGHSAIRAGLLTATPSLPQLYVPNVMAFARQQRPLTTLEGGANSSVADEDVDALVNGELLAAGPAAYAPAVRQRARLVSPLKLLETDVYANGKLAIRYLFQYIFSRLRVEPSTDNRSKYSLFLILPRSLANAQLRLQLMNFLFEELPKNVVHSVALTTQSFAAFYAFGKQTGICLNLGASTETTAITDGFSQPAASMFFDATIGGEAFLQAFQRTLQQRQLRYLPGVERELLVRYLMHAGAVVGQTPDAAPPADLQLSLEAAELPAEARAAHELYERVRLAGDVRAEASVGLLDGAAWGTQFFGLHRLLHREITACPLDVRRSLFRNVFLVGALAARLPGLSERLAAELSRLVENTNTEVKVFTCPEAEHAAYIGAQRLLHSCRDVYAKQVAISREKWAVSAGPAGGAPLASRTCVQQLLLLKKFQ